MILFTNKTQPLPMNGVASPWGGEVFVLPATVSQQGFWYLDRLDPGNPAYNIAVRFRLQGPVRPDVLERALGAIVRRHESLRTVFAADDGEPVQVVAPALTVHLPVIDLRGLPAADRHARSEQLTVEEARRRFDLTAGPLIRFGLLRLDADDHVLLVTVHHIVSDGWSIGVITQELGVLYDAFCRDLPAPLPDLPLQYGDFAVWQERWLVHDQLAAQLAYWKDRLAGLPPLEIRPDRPRPAVRTAHGEIESNLLAADLTDALKALSERHGCTFFMLALAALKTLLYRYTGGTDIYVGTLTAGRSRVELEPLIGPFINPLVLRTDLSGDPSFLDLLDRVRETVLDALSHQEVPFERVVEAVQPNRDPRRHPVFDINFIYQRDFVRPLDAAGVTLTAIPSRSPGAIYDLNFFMVERAEGWRASCEYHTDLYDAATIKRLLGSFQALLAGIAADPDRRISELPLLSPAERHQVVVEWNDTAATAAAGCVHELFETQAEIDPDAVAIEFGARRLTYRELNRSANQLAHHLRRHGVGPEVVVGICVDRSPEMVVGLLGILKAGGAYLPLDPEYPPDRLAYLIADARPPVVLTMRRIASRLPDQGTQRVYLDEDQAALARESPHNLAPGATTGNLAYLIYTSGTTGQPKGVMVEHRGLSNYLHWAARAYDVAAGQGAPVHSSISFDLTITALFAPLIAGRRVDLLGEGPGAPALGAVFRCGADYSLVKITPAHLQLLGEQIAAGEAAGRTRAFVIGGEQLTGEHVAFWRENAPDTILYNEYGPTETVVGCCVHRVVPGDSFRDGAVPIGRPIANTRLYILDLRGNPVPAGVTGELYIGGAGVARGYLDRPRHTAATFLPDAFGEEPGARLYRTGDLCRQRPDGALEFVGRADRQIKIRGFRVEPGEVEAVLTQHPAVREALALAREDGTSGMRLIAYVVPEAGLAADAPELRRWLKERLPAHLVPSEFAILAALPLSANGKVDRAQLPAPAPVVPGEFAEFVAPRDETEALLAELWARTLGVKRVSTTADFFDEGGHSLLALRLLARLEKAFGRRLPLAALMQAPTVQTFAERLRLAPHAASERPSERVIPIQPEGSRTPFFIVNGGPKYRPLARRLGRDQPIFNLVLPAVTSLPDGYTVQDVAAVLSDALRAVQPQGPYYLGGWSGYGLYAYELAQQLRARGEDVALLALFDTSHPRYLLGFKTLKSLPVQIYLACEKLRHHAAKMRRMTPGERRRYALERSWMALLRWRYYVLKRVYRVLNQPGVERFNTMGAWPFLVTAERYEPEPYPLPVVLFRSTALQTGRFRDPLLGWEGVIPGLEVHEMPGEHETMFHEPIVERLAEGLNASLTKGTPPAPERTADRALGLLV